VRRSHGRPAPTAATRRKKHHLGFAVLASGVVGVLVLAIVVLHVLLAQQSFRLDEVERRIEVLGTEQLELVTQQATLSAPVRIAAWADRHGMRLPDDIRILRAPNGPDDPAGAGPSQGASDR
jgi:cell division protein FtsL